MSRCFDLFPDDVSVRCELDEGHDGPHRGNGSCFLALWPVRVCPVETLEIPILSPEPEPMDVERLRAKVEHLLPEGYSVEFSSDPVERNPA